MRKFFTFLILLASALSLCGADIITATITLTNESGVANGSTITINGATRTWYNTVTNEPVEIQTTNTLAWAKTNLYLHLAKYPPAGLVLGQSSTNVITLRTSPGGSVEVTVSSGWATVSYGTQTVATAYAVRVPHTIESAAQQTNIWSMVASALASDVVTNPIAANLVGLTNEQTISGIKRLTNHDNVLAGSLFAVGADAWVWNPTNNVTTLYFGANDRGGITNYIQSTPAGIVLGTGPTSSIMMTGNLELGDANIIGTDVRIDDAGFHGNGVGITNISGTNIIAGSIKSGQIASEGIALTGTNSVADIAFPRGANTGLANGNNAGVQVGTNTFLQVSGPTLAFSICGLDGQPNRDGKLVILLNYTGQDMTIAHDSGVEPTAANRIYTMTGSDRSTTGNGAAVLIYSASASRWVLISLDP